MIIYFLFQFLEEDGRPGRINHLDRRHYATGIRRSPAGEARSPRFPADDRF